MAEIGVDFGYGKTGIALLDGGKVLACRVIQHRTDISNKLLERRQNRAMRRRNESRRRRLRDFHALLKGMGLEPSKIRPGEKIEAEQRILPGNLLYASAHHRGWDYAQCLDMLWQDGKKGAAVLPMDRMLVEYYGAPVKFKEAKKPKNPTSKQADYEELRAAAEKYINKHGKLTGEKDKKYFRFAAPKSETEFLGELHRLETENAALRKKAEKFPEDETLETAIAGNEAESNRIQKLFSEESRGGKMKETIEKWMREQLQKIYGGAPEKGGEIITAAMTLLGLQPGENLFKEGKIYRPHRNRNRSEMLGEMEKLLDAVCGGEEFGAVFAKHFAKVYKTAKPEQKPAAQKEAKRAWRDAALRVRKRADELAQKRAEKENREVNRKDILAFWQNAAEKIIKREYRKKRFNNRKIGKCPAQAKNGERCGRNVPRKNHETVRHLQFEIELRQMNVLDGGELRKLENTEVAGAMEKLIFANKPSADEQTQNRAAIAGLPKTRKAKNESRGKKDILRDIACGAQNGRAGFCANHLREKLQLIKDEKTESEEWARLHKERILAAADAPPSTRQKVWRVQKTVQLMLKKHGIAPEEITHVGLETARFDINSLAQEEGRKGKTARNYQTSRRPDNRRDLAEQQGGLCLICGELLGADIHADHFFPKSRGGAFARLNLVALHTACNINKNNNLISINALNEDAAAHLRANDPKKFRYLQKNMEDKDARQNLTKAPQHTMLGAKILREELRKTLGVGKEKTAEIFKRIRGQDAALLRERWFPHMHRQKRALREQLRNKGNQYFLAFTAGEKSVRKLPPNNHLFSAGEKLKIENAEADDWLKLENGASDLVGNPKGDEPARDIYITAQNGRAELELITDGDAPPPDLGKYKKTAVGKTVNIPLANIRPKEWEKFAARVAPSWLLLENGKLTGTIPPPENGKFVPKAARVEFYKDGELIGSVKIAVRTAQKIRVAVVPPKTDNIHSFHHALDAVVLAANVDWKKITRLGKDPRTRNLNQREAMEKEIQKAAPDFSAWELPALDGKPDGELCAPEKKADYFYEDREDRGRVSASKHDREPYGFAKFKDDAGEKYRVKENETGEHAVKRAPLPNIARKNVENIIGVEIRTAMAAAWQKIDNMPPEEKSAAESKQGAKTYITEKYFLGLPHGDILHPFQTRSARCWAADSMKNKESYEALPDKRWGEKDKRENKIHYFRRKVAWEKAIVFERGGKLRTAWEKNRFYWHNKNVPEYKGGVAPKKDEIRRVFRRGDTIKIDGEKWKITALGARKGNEKATLAQPGKKDIEQAYLDLYRQTRTNNAD